jgi:hypothetical protein
MARGSGEALAGEAIWFDSPPNRSSKFLKADEDHHSFLKLLLNRRSLTRTMVKNEDHENLTEQIFGLT